ncbi:hypothetical protein L484_020293 [Morus notabilis]|uniref:Uncharacterized protein n=1 Tax=Morus notabilis TaxID=981085 RepID=W9QPD5_9ROSA|nr:protein N-lysine methyltransferase METTL21A [Morus notabilis]EXB37234.1 hypothetical protein L484_020293 [Morus notabilis]
MATTMFEQDEDEEDINPFTMLLTQDENGDTKEHSTLHASPGVPQLQQHYIRSIDTELTIRQLPSQGLSFQLWPAATTLVNLPDDHRRDPRKGPLSAVLSAALDGPDRRRLKILELGSGTGLVGIAAAVMLGANVTVTDLPHVIPNLEFSAEANSKALTANGGNVVASALRWGEEADVEVIGPEFDLVLASDVVYHDHLYEPLLRTLYSLLSGRETTSFVRAHLRRWKKDSAFFKKARKAFNVEVLHEDTHSEGSRIGVVVYRFCGKQIRKLGLAKAENA